MFCDMSSSNDNNHFADFPVEAFPFIVDFLDLNGQIVHTITVTGAGAVEVPALAHEHGPVSVRITYADGSIEYESAPDSV